MTGDERLVEELAEVLWDDGLQPAAAGQAARAAVAAAGASRWAAVRLGTSGRTVLHVRVHDDLPPDPGRPAGSPDVVSTGRMEAP